MLRPKPCLSRPWLHNPFVGQLFREGRRGWQDRSPFVRPRTELGAGGQGEEPGEAKELSHRGAAVGQRSAECGSPVAHKACKVRQAQI